MTQEKANAAGDWNPMAAAQECGAIVPQKAEVAELFSSDAFGEVHAAMGEDGIARFCAKDVARALGYANTKDAVKTHCKGVAFYYPLETAGGIQSARFIAEPDVYRLITHSKLPNAQRFEAWVFEEVLPAIRRDGAYVASDGTEDEGELIARALVAANRRLEESNAKVARLQARNAELAPKAFFADAVSSSAGSILVGELAKLLRQNGLPMGQKRLFAWLRENGYLMRGSKGNVPTQRSMEMGLFEVKESTVTHSDGHTTVSYTPKVTGKGQVYFVGKLCRQSRMEVPA